MNVKVNKVMFIFLDWTETQKYWSRILLHRTLHNQWVWQLIYHNHYFCLFVFQHLGARETKRTHTSLISYNRQKSGYSSLVVQPCEWILKTLQQAFCQANSLKEQSKLNIFQWSGVSIKNFKAWFCGLYPYFSTLLTRTVLSQFRLEVRFILR